jgi:hypothetical protein
VVRGVTQIVMGSLLFPLFKIIYGGNDSGKVDADELWRFLRDRWKMFGKIDII